MTSVCLFKVVIHVTYSIMCLIKCARTLEHVKVDCRRRFAWCVVKHRRTYPIFLNERLCHLLMNFGKLINHLKKKRTAARILRDKVS